MKLPRGWYAIALTKEFPTSKPRRIRRFGRDFVIWRNSQGGWIAQSDLCPHRGASLSLGWVENDCLRCPFHGFSFDASGVCTHVPELKRGAPSLQLTTWPLVERHGILWLNWSAPPSATIPWFEDLEDPSFTFATSVHTWPQNFSRCVENQLDYAHLPFVHKNSIGKNFDPCRKIDWLLDEKALRVYTSPPDQGGSFFEFRFPNIWRLHISDRMVHTLLFVPVDEMKTLIYSRSYHRLTRLPLIRELIAWLSVRVGNPYILAQDQKVACSQRPADSREATGEHLVPSDRAIVAFRQWLATD